MKKICFILALILILFTLTACETPEQYSSQPLELYARYMTNCESEISLQSGLPAQGENVLFYAEKIVVGQLLTAPTSIPVREGYVFDGWCFDKEGLKAWDFSADKVESGVTLYAKWNRTAAADGETYVEPVITYTPTVDDTIEAGIVLQTICCAPVTDSKVNLTQGGIELLKAHSQDITDYLTYTRKNNASITSALYNVNSNSITISYNEGTETKQISVNITNVTASYAVAGSAYENKAVKYENNSGNIEPHSIILGGSSSMENWSSSTVDLAPLTTTNHGIGGTTVEQWRDSLAERLIYPFNPRAVVLYIGVNNIISSKKSGEETGNALLELLDNIHARLPDCTVYFILINQLTGFAQYKDAINTANNIVLNHASQSGNDWLVTIDAGATLYKPSGELNNAYFLTDGLHLTQSGYIVWGGAVKEAFLEHEKELY